MKRFFYISLFTFLGILVQFILHGLIEFSYIKLLIYDYDKFGLGLSWDNWFLIHKIFSIALLVLGASLGFIQGKYWWRVIYIEKRYKKWIKN